MNMRPTSSPWGGGNQWLQQMIRNLTGRGYAVVFDLTRPVEFSATGPFAIVRHPIYLGWLLIVFATPVMTMSQLLFAVTSTIYLIAAIPFEEASLVEAFGEKRPPKFEGR